MTSGNVQFTGFTDPLEMLEIVHAAARRLRDLAGPALVITIEPAEQKAPDAPPVEHRPAGGPKARSQAIEQQVLTYLREHGGRARKAAIIQDTGISKKGVHTALQRLQAQEKARRTGDQERAPGTTAGRPSPVWELTTSGTTAATQEPPPPPAGDEEITVADIDTDETDPKTDVDEHDDQHPRDPISARTRKSLERAEAERRAAAALGDPPTSDVFDVLRERSATVRELAALLGRDQVLVAEEVHVLKPWLVELHAGKLRAVERLRRQAEAA